jgi:nucleoside-diphosphate-sugar epimerase
MSDPVLVTGAFGLVGSATVKHLAAQKLRVVATDLDTPANRAAAEQLPRGAIERWADLTDRTAVDALLRQIQPSAIIHLAAVIPPLCYAKPRMARRVNVEATGNLVRAAETQPNPPRFVQASSIAVYGPRNPYSHHDVLTADTPVKPFDNYGRHKVEAEQIVHGSCLNWVILRLGGVLTVEPNLGMDRNLLFFEGVLPTDGRIQTVDVRDVARAFAAATTADVVGQTLLIGGDQTHRQVQGEIGAALTTAMGLAGALPTGRNGDPNDDAAWFATDWMDSATAQRALNHQHHSWPDMLAEIATSIGWRRHLLRLAAPLAHEYLKRQSPHYGQPSGFSNPWEAVRAKWGAPDNEGLSL